MDTKTQNQKAHQPPETSSEDIFVKQSSKSNKTNENSFEAKIVKSPESIVDEQNENTVEDVIPMNRSIDNAQKKEA